MPGIFAPIGLPGPGTVVAAAHKHVFKGLWDQMLPGGKLIDGAVARDPTNTGYLTVLQPGVIMGKITSGGKYANSILGLSTGALTSTGTTLSAGAATVTELVRRVGATGTFKLTGPPTAAGTVRTITVTYSAASGTSITITAIGATSTYTLTLQPGTDGGTFAVKVTNPAGVSQTTAGQAWNVTAANLDTALEGLSIVGTGGVATTLVGEAYTLVFASTLGDMKVEIVQDTTNDGGVFEGGITAAQTVSGVDGRFVTASFIQPTDGSEAPLTFVPDGYGIRLADDTGTTYTVPFPEMPIAGMVEAAQIINYPADASLKEWLKLQFRNAGLRLTWDDNF